jgi:hypothetical protein
VSHNSCCSLHVAVVLRVHGTQVEVCAAESKMSASHKRAVVALDNHHRVHDCWGHHGSVLDHRAVPCHSGGSDGELLPLQVGAVVNHSAAKVKVGAFWVVTRLADRPR